MFTGVILKRGQSPVKGALIGLLIFGGVLLISGCSEGGGASEDAMTISSDDQPTPIRFEGQSTPVLLPHTNLYIYLTSSRPLYYRNGRYFQYYQDHWYRSEDMKGPWEQVDETQIPDLLHNIPPNYYYDNFPYKLRNDTNNDNDDK